MPGEAGPDGVRFSLEWPAGHWRLSLAPCSILVAVPAAGFLVPLFLLLLIQSQSVSAAERSYEGKVPAARGETLTPLPKMSALAPLLLPLALRVLSPWSFLFWLLKTQILPPSWVPAPGASCVQVILRPGPRWASTDIQDEPLRRAGYCR